MEVPALRFRALRRPRITGLIASGFGELAPLTLLHAPAGFGKTTAVVHWAEAVGAEGDVRWVNAPGPGSDPRTVWHRLRQSLDAAAGNVHRRSEARVREEADRILRDLSRPTVIVIDDYQYVTSGELDLAIARLLERSTRLHLIVLSRRFTALDGPLVSSRVPVTVIEGDDLALTEDEGRDLAELYDTDNHYQVERMRQRVRGWPLVMRSVLQEVSDGRDMRAAVRTLARFGRQHLDAVTMPGARRAALVTALCPAISTEVVAEAIEEGYEQTEVVMRELGELGLVQQSWWSDTTRYRCHEGLRGSLEPLALQEFGEEARGLRLRHATDLARDAPFEAVVQLLELEEYGAVARLFARYFLEITASGDAILQRLRQIPDDVLRAHPALIGATLHLEIPELGTSHERMERMYQWLRTTMRTELRDGNYEQNAAAIALLLTAERMRGDGAETLRIARDIEARTERIPESRLPSYRFTAPLLFSALGFSGLVAGDLALGERGYRRAIELAERFENIPEELRGWNGLALIAAVDGDLVAAEERLRRGRALGEQERVPIPQLSWVNAMLAEALIDAEQGRAESALAVLGEGRRFLKKAEHWPLLVVIETQARRLADGPDAALELLRHRREEARGGYAATLFLRCRLAAQEARLNVILGNYAEAERLLDSLPQNHPDVAVVRAMLHLFGGESARVLSQAESAAQCLLSARQKVEAGLIGAVALFDESSACGSGRPGAGADAVGSGRAIDQFAEAGTAARELGLSLAFGSVPFDRLSALAHAAEEAGAIDLVERVGSLPETLRAEAFSPLSRAELRTLVTLATGLTLPRIAERLFITENTVKFHLKSIYRKLRVSSRAEAVERARRMGFVNREEEG